MKDIRADMTEIVEEGAGPFQHNIISITLRIIAQKHGVALADQMVEEFELEALFGIKPELPQAVARAITGD